MVNDEKKSPLNARLVMPFVVVLVLVFSCLPSYAQKIVRGTIKGSVAADQGQVIGFRVAAHNLDRKIWYTVFTVKGQYTIPQALPGRYEVMVYEPEYDSPTSPVQIGPGESKTADFMIKRRSTSEGFAASNLERADNEARRKNAADANAGKIEYVSSMDEIFPPGPGLDMLKENCTGCHADDRSIGKNFSGMHYSKEKFMEGLEQATETGPSNNEYALALSRTIISKSQKEVLVDYLFKNFGPGTVEKRLRVDPLVVDEDVAGKMIYVSYDVPEDLPVVGGGNVIGAPMIDGVIPQMPAPFKGSWLGNGYISPVDGNIWYTSKASSSIIKLDPKSLDWAERWKNFPIKGDIYTFPEGIAVDKQNRVYWAEDKTAMLGELDPVTGRQIRHALPARAGIVNAVVIDKDGNVGFDLIYGAFFGRMEATSRKLHMYPTPTPDNGMYGLAVDQQNNLWGAGWEKGTISKWDAETQTVKEYKVPNSWGQVRRIGVDSKGIVWASEYESGFIARLDPSTGKLTEYKIPVSGAKPYDCWADKSDDIWAPDQVHSTLAKLDPKTGKFTFYPMPQPHQSVNKIEVADDNTIWMPTRGMKIVTGVHLYPNGYTNDSPPLP
jgi:virginiamycin B lyase